MNSSVLEKDRLMAEATEWLTCLNEPKVAVATRGNFILWLMRSCAHVEAFLTVSRVYGAVSSIKQLPGREELVRQAHAEAAQSNVVTLRPSGETALILGLPERSEALASPSVRAPAGRYAAAAALAVLALSVSGLALKRWVAPTSVHTAVGEQRSIALDDGTTVHLNTDTALRVNLSKADRRIALTRGEARFAVAKDPSRPFIVTTPQAVVVALGTEFNVRIIGQRTVVSVMEGHIKVERRDGLPERGDAVELRAQEQAIIDATGPVRKNTGPPFDRAVDWTQRRLVCHDETLAVLVAEFNRYNKQPLVIADAELAAHRIDGGFDVFDRASLVEYLRRYQGVRVSEENGILMMRRSASTSTHQ